MRFHSTLESVQNGEITQFAIIECVVAVAIYIGIGVYFKTFRLLALAVALAPLTLLRTEASVRWGLKTYEGATAPARRVMERNPRGLKGLLLLLISFVLFVPLAGAVVRVVATLYWTLRKPVETLRGMPGNWLRQAFCTDFFYPPEVVPLEAVYGDKEKLPIFNDGIEYLRGKHVKDLSDFAIQIPFLAVFMVLGFLPPLLYRVSFKATSLAYAPFVWVAHATLRAPESIKLRMERITKGELEKTRRWVSGLIATALAAKFALARGWIDVAAVVAKFPSKKFVESFLIANVWPWWQITLGIDALMTFCLLLYADAALARLEGKGAWREEVLAGTISTASFVRASLGIITMSHFFYVALTTVTAGHIRLPNL
jgi:hypothetical protein